MLRLVYTFLSFPQIKKLELKLKEQEHDRSAEELKVTPIKIKHCIYIWLWYMNQFNHYCCFFFQIRIKDLERKLKEQEHQQSVAELKVLLERMCYL
jgi:kinesin family protein C2/C3